MIIVIKKGILYNQVPRALKVKILLLVSTIFVLMISAKEKSLVLERIPYIYYLVQFKKDVEEI